LQRHLPLSETIAKVVQLHPYVTPPSETNESNRIGVGCTYLHLSLQRTIERVGRNAPSAIYICRKMNQIGLHWPMLTPLINDRGEPAGSCKWTGWVWEITSWSPRLQENYRPF
jgi:hypothetical protein